MWCSLLKSLVFIWVLSYINCSPVTNDLNTNLIRDYLSTSDHTSNSTNVKTLQKEDFARYAYNAIERRPVVFKEIPDNALSGSSHSRGIHHPHGGYARHDYDESHGHGYDFDHYGHGHDVHGHYGHPLSYGHHHNHYDHGLAAKSLLLPIAGIALLGAAAALVSNPVLLQLGVISGRKRRDIDATNFDINFESWYKDGEDSNKTEKQAKPNNKQYLQRKTISHHGANFNKRNDKSNNQASRGSIDDKTQNGEETKRYSSKKVLQRYKLKKSTSPKEELAIQSPIETVTPEAHHTMDGDSLRDRLVPVPLTIRGD